MLPLAQVIRGFKSGQWVTGWMLSFAMVILVIGLALVLPKGAYVVSGLATVLTLAALIAARRSKTQPSKAGPFALAGFVATLAGVTLVANHWGDDAGLMHAVPVVFASLFSSGWVSQVQENTIQLSLIWRGVTYTL